MTMVKIVDRWAEMEDGHAMGHALSVGERGTALLNHAERIDAARAAIDYITGRSAEQQQRPVPNCPGWTVYNAAAHIGRVSIAWEEMILASPDDPQSRERGYERSGKKPAGTPTTELAAWAHSAIDQLIGDTDRRCYFSMTGGEGTVGLWGWHAASELGVHRLDVEAALGHDHALTDEQAIDAATYTCQYFLPAMRRVTGKNPGGVEAQLHGDDGVTRTTSITPAPDDESNATSDTAAPGRVTIAGPSTQVLLALWGRPHTGVAVIDGDDAVWTGWQALPGEAFQFGTWD